MSRFMIFDSAATEDVDGNITQSNELYFTKTWQAADGTAYIYDGSGGGELVKTYYNGAWIPFVGQTARTKPVKVHGSDGKVGFEFHFDFNRYVERIKLHFKFFLEFCSDVPFFSTAVETIPGTNSRGIRQAFNRTWTAGIPLVGGFYPVWTREQDEELHGDGVVYHHSVIRHLRDIGLHTNPDLTGLGTAVNLSDDRYVPILVHANYVRLVMSFGNEYAESVLSDYAMVPANVSEAYQAVQRIRVFAVCGGTDNNLSVSKPISGFYA